MTTAIFSIHPHFANMILSGEKKFEFRRIPAKRDIDKMLIYATAPFCAVVGEVQVLDLHSACPATLWEVTRHFAGITSDQYEQYFAGCHQAYAYRLALPIRYSVSEPLSLYGIKRAPQSFCYVKGVK